MSINPILTVTSVPTTTATTSKTSGKISTKSTETTNTSTSTGVIYEKSTTIDSTPSYQVENADLIKQLKADAEQKTSQLQSLVEQMMRKQGATIGKTDDFWHFLASGDFTVDATTKAQAQEDISEDGYWGINQTSDRIIEFAKALTGGDPSKADAMKNAFEKGFKEATKTWGKDLPDISRDTYNAVMAKFDNWSNESN